MVNQVCENRHILRRDDTSGGRIMFKPIDPDNPIYGFKRCPKCKKEFAQLVGHETDDKSHKVLHKCKNCLHVSPYWLEAERKEVIPISSLR